MSEEDVRAELERLRAENDRLKQQQGGRTVSLRVSEKGGVSVYGLMRFPVTLYKEQWVKLLEMADEIRAFIRDNEAKLKTKEGGAPAAKGGAAPKKRGAADDAGGDAPDDDGRKTFVP
jgi:hypothetical protein